MQRSYLEINSDGTLEYVFEERSPRGLSETIIKEFGSKVPRLCKNAFTVDGMPCALSISPAETYCYVMLNFLTIRCAYKAGPDKYLRPFFEAGQTIDPSIPEFEGKWVPPIDMRLIFAAKIYNPDTSSPSTKPQKSCYLLSIDKLNRCWRLPLPNLYDLGDLCMGDFDGVGRSVQMAFTRAYDQFHNARWNADLFTGDKGAGARELFRFTLNNETLSSVAFPNGYNWQAHCAKAVTPITNMLVESLK